MCPIDRPDFSDTGPVRAHLVVFPRTAVSILHEGGEPVLADPSVAMLYNRDQAYRRRAVHPAGDFCDWVALSEDAVRGIVEGLDRDASDGDRPIRFSHAPCPARLYLLQRLLVRAIDGGEVEPIEVEETALRVFASALRGAYESRRDRAPRRMRQTTARAHREAVDDVRAALMASLDEPFTLEDAARVAHLSPHHLSRVFRRITGQTLSRYRTGLRLRVALERVIDGREDLTAAALAAGFSSHSHFTNRFRERFGVPPSAVRREDLVHLLREMRTSVQAGETPDGRGCAGRGRRSAA